MSILKDLPLNEVADAVQVNPPDRVVLFRPTTNDLRLATAGQLLSGIDLTSIEARIDSIDLQITDINGQIVNLINVDLAALQAQLDGLQNTTIPDIIVTQDDILQNQIPNLQANLNGQIGTINSLLGDTDIGDGVTVTQRVAEYKISLDEFSVDLSAIELDLDPNNPSGVIASINSQFASLSLTVDGLTTSVGALEGHFETGGRVSLAETNIAQNANSITQTAQRLEYTNLVAGDVDAFSSDVLTDNDNNFVNLGIQVGHLLYFTTGDAVNEPRVVEGVTANTLTLKPGSFTDPAIGDGYIVSSPGSISAALLKVSFDQIESKVSQTNYDTFINTTYPQDLSALNDSIQAASEGTLTTYFQPGTPSGANPGDLWIDTDDDNSIKRFNGTIWEDASDSRIGQALTNAATAQATADGKIQTFLQASPPSDTPGNDLGVGDIWFDTDNNNIPHRWDGTEWVELDDQRFTDIAADLSSIQGSLDGKITSFFQSTPPVGDLNEGDLWTDTDNGQIFRWDPNASGGTGAWVDAADSRLAQAISDSSTALATADGKVASFFQNNAPADNPPGTLSEGDLWFDTDNNYRIHHWDESANGGAGGWVDASDRRIQTNTSSIIQNANSITSLVERFEHDDITTGTISSYNDSTKEMVDSLKNFVQLGIQIGYVVEFLDGPAAGQLRTILGVSINNLVLQDTGGNDPEAGDSYQISTIQLIASSRIRQLADEIELRVTTSDFNVLEGRVDSAESSITQNADSITSVVSRFEFFNEITGITSSYNDSLSQLTDNSKNFVALGVQPGYVVEFLDGPAAGQLRTITSLTQTNLVLHDPGGNDPTVGDGYKISGIQFAASSMVKQLSDQIIQRVQVGQVASQLTQDMEGFTFDANKVQSQNFNGVIDSNGDMITPGTLGFAIDRNGVASFKKGFFAGFEVGKGGAAFSDRFSAGDLEIIGGDNPKILIKDGAFRTVSITDESSFPGIQQRGSLSGQLSQTDISSFDNVDLKTGIVSTPTKPGDVLEWEVTFTYTQTVSGTSNQELFAVWVEFVEEGGMTAYTDEVVFEKRVGEGNSYSITLFGKKELGLFFVPQTPDLGFRLNISFDQIGNRIGDLQADFNFQIYNQETYMNKAGYLNQRSPTKFVSNEGISGEYKLDVPEVSGLSFNDVLPYAGSAVKVLDSTVTDQDPFGADKTLDIYRIYYVHIRP